MGEGVPATYVPARNTIFLAFALAYGETIGATDIFIGANAIDYSGYPDCRPEFLAAFQHMARLGTRLGSEGAPLTIHAPLIALTKAEIVRRGLALGVDFARTRTCYDPAPDGAACGRCDACQLRLKGFRDAGLEDPAPYAWRPGGVVP
jgi:7-cyano-7-deazaguanine synthase